VRHAFIQEEAMRHLASLVVLLGAAPGAPSQEQEFKLSANAELVLLDVGVQDKNGGFVSNLKIENFKILENGKPQSISHFANDDVPVTVGLVIDNSGSMAPKRPEVVTAGLAFVRASNPADEIFVTEFNDRARLMLPSETPFTGEPAILRAALLSAPAEGRTALYDAVLLSLNHLEHGKRDKKALIVVSDGGDNASVHTLKDLMPAVRESRATIYTIGIFDNDDPDRNPRLLRNLASISGGEVFFPKQLDELLGICKKIAQDIRTRYTIGYVPVRTDEKGSLRNIRVTVTGTDRRDLIVHARTTYLLPERTTGGQ
jgi:VWFA-related protein